LVESPVVWILRDRRAYSTNTEAKWEMSKTKAVAKLDVKATLRRHLVRRLTDRMRSFVRVVGPELRAPQSRLRAPLGRRSPGRLAAAIFTAARSPPASAGQKRFTPMK
jgi:hypothetical protein